MFITRNASPGELLSQLITLRGATPEDTKGFKRLSHNKDLCPAFHDKVEIILESFNRHKTSALDIQGFRDNGADILFRFEDDEGNRDSVGLQVKSQKEIEDDVKRPIGQASLVKELKAQRTEAQSKHRISMFYILLCCDITKHLDYVRKVAAEFTSLDDVKVIWPQQAWNFYNIDESEIVARCNRILCEDDYVVVKARRELDEISPEQKRIIIGSIVHQQEGTHTFSADDLCGYATCGLLNEFEDTQDRADEALQNLMSDRVLLTDDGSNFTFDAQEYPAIRALYFDLLVRHRLSGEDAIRYLLMLTADSLDEGSEITADE